MLLVAYYGFKLNFCKLFGKDVQIISSSFLDFHQATPYVVHTLVNQTRSCFSQVEPRGGEKIKKLE